MSISESLSIPGPEFFQAAFGCSSSIDHDLVQTCQFIDKKGDAGNTDFWSARQFIWTGS